MVRWVYNKQNFLETGYLKAFYLPKGLTAQTLPPAYAQLVAYVDCLMDPSFQKTLPASTPKEEDYGSDWFSLPKNWQQLPKNEQKDLLDTLRSLRVIGYCSQDSRPRDHAVAIATVAAHATQWDVFLRAHLDVLNDKFTRMSDGSYAWAQRQTYLQELEALKINVPNLLLGIALRVNHPADHHYMGNISRLGRAVVESKDKTAILQRLLLMIEDPQLDIFNRRIAANFYWSYLSYLDLDDSILPLQINALKKALKTLPTALQKGLTFERWEAMESKE